MVEPISLDWEWELQPVILVVHPTAAMAEYESSHHNYTIPKETAPLALNTIIQLHFEKTLEKKRAVDLQKKELWKLFQHFFLFLALVFTAQV
ncbi:hypothetical protein L1987_48316 [Smallanthus sonchifolius]|uniref:Uncharacterized protein n=1 Tax=Smallanthus sonchifolius TaxID=185202 RepID=A0ACB9FQZ8_9ASTR|nr:hypothetical protein L1987_48316 [Smallanthus sonchifolius]